jgi:hypothetical protein
MSAYIVTLFGVYGEVIAQRQINALSERDAWERTSRMFQAIGATCYDVRPLEHPRHPWGTP